MHRIDGADNADGLFQAGDKALGVEATEVTPDWANDVQETLARAIEEYGIELEKGNYTQLIAVLAKLALKGGDAAQAFLVAAPSLSTHAARYADILERGPRASQTVASVALNTTSWVTVASITDGNTVRGAASGKYDFLVEFSGVFHLGAEGHCYIAELQVNGVTVQTVEYDTGSNEFASEKHVHMRRLVNGTSSFTASVRMKAAVGSGDTMSHRCISSSALLDADASGAA